MLIKVKLYHGILGLLRVSAELKLSNLLQLWQSLNDVFAEEKT